MLLTYVQAYEDLSETDYTMLEEEYDKGGYDYSTFEIYNSDNPTTTTEPPVEVETTPASDRVVEEEEEAEERRRQSGPG